MPTPNITNEFLRQVLNYDRDTGLFTWIVKTSSRACAGSIAGAITPHGYVRISIKGRDYYAHRLAWFYIVGDWPQNVIDHINGKRDDNRFINLRDVDALTNNQNQHKAHSHNTHSKLLGVSFDKNKKKWLAHATINNKFKFLGYYSSSDEAHEVSMQFRRDNFLGFTI